MDCDCNCDLDNEEEDSCIADESCSFYSEDNLDLSRVCSENDTASIISRNLEDSSIDFDCSTGNVRSSDSDSDDMRKRKRASHAQEKKRRHYITAIYDMLGRPAKEKWGRITKLTDGLKLNYGSLCDVTEDVNTIREGKGKAT
eukprot:5275453-Ditylum_brightwellii.AAC.1